VKLEGQRTESDELQMLREMLRPRTAGPWRRYLLSPVAVGLCTALGELIDPFLPISNLVMLYLLAVVAVAVFAGRGPAVATALLSVAAFNFFFVPPRYTFDVGDAEYLITFAGLLIIGLVTSTLASRAREQAQAARRRQAQTAALFDLSRDLAATARLQPILDVVTGYIEKMFDTPSVIALPDSEGGIDEQVNEETARFPLRTVRGTVGVLSITIPDDEHILTSEQRAMLEASASLAAIAIERAQLSEQARRIQLMQETEKLQSALLNSLSHDLRTPLASITGALSSLQQDADYLSESARQELVITALDQAGRLNRLVRNLLDMTRLEADAVHLTLELTTVQEVVGVALQQISDRLGVREVTINIPANMPDVSIDLVLIAQVLVNLLDNALKYSLPTSPIEISAHLVASEVEISVADHGTGIPPQDLEHVFDKFYRVQRPDNVVGTGLGLAISRGLVEAHRGRIKAENRPNGGTIVKFTLPAQ
jgi:two-component system, OmpR family, sensor histidine kinase KdpD